MAKFALTEAGAASKLSEIYALSDPARMAEAAAIKSDFAGWMDDNFTLTSPQASYISGMASDATDYYGSLCCLCFQYKLDIDFVYPSPPPLAVGKWVESEDKAKVRTSGNGDVEVTGSAVFTVVYVV